MDEYVVVDLEMTGLSARDDQIIEIGAIRVKNHEIVDKMECLVNPRCKIPERVTELTGITDEMVKNGEDRDGAIEKLLDFIGDSVLVGQNISFDYSFLKQWAVNHKRAFGASACDTLKIARAMLPADASKRLEALCEWFGITRERGHRALDDVIATWQVFEKLEEMAAGRPECAVYFEPKPLTYRAKKQTPATAHQLQRLREYCEKHQITDVIEWENLTRSQASRLMDGYILKHGR